MSRRRTLIWAIPTFLYILFVGWYTDFGGPLDDAEIATYLERFEAIDPSTTDGDRCSRKSENLGEALAEA